MDFYDVFKDGSILFMRTTREVEWDAVEIQTLLILSFGAQVICTFFGNHRKYRLRSLSRLVLWLSYLTASPMVTLLLGKLSGIAVTAYDVQGSYELLPNDIYGEYGYLVNSWAPLLLVQICSPNIISYSVEDNKLMLRQAFGLTSQVAIAFWIFYQSLFVEDAPYTTTLSLYVVGIIKVGERLRALWSLNSIITIVSLAGAIVLDLYLIMELLFSVWAILHLMKQNRGALTRRLFIIVAPKIPIKKHRWSHCMDQFNLLSYCLHEEPTKLGRLIRRILKIKGYYKEYKKSCVKKDIQVPEELKKLLLQQMEEVRAQRGWQSFSKMREWALERCNCLPDFEWSIQTDFGTQANKQTNLAKPLSYGTLLQIFATL
ncbi:hypothetical protein Patl1_14470 [Pistacia atlantica]|uniref:Uncharacterized protein n=1 Tax=Pistacia atlantica TaxID=434234 RepID=A0ACC1AUE2_9ROSI|nr:hypothetical protein Patl1_14470 [Pistacia atlantica]